jgi:pimeloyl-ACP methyl ester carboxylesterase
LKSESGGDFANTNFSGTINDLISAAEFLKNNYRAPSVIVGHSLGGAASLLAASRLEEIKAVAIIGAPAAQHVTSLLQNRIAERKKPGSAKINISGRPFLIKKQFVEDLEGQNLLSVVREMRGKRFCFCIRRRTELFRLTTPPSFSGQLSNQKVLSCSTKRSICFQTKRMLYTSAI